MKTLFLVAVSIPGYIVLGRLAMQALRIEPEDGLLNFIISTTLGIGLTGIAWFLLGIAGFYHPAVAWAFLIVAPALGYRLWLPTLSNLWKWLNGIEWKSLEPLEIMGLALSAGVLFLLILAALNPSIDADALGYHLAVPKLYIQHGGIYYIPFNFYSNWPSLIEMLYVWALLLGSEAMAQETHLLLTVLAFLATFVLARSYLSRRVSILAATLFLNIPTVMFVASLAYNDMAQAAFFTTAFIAYFTWRDNEDDRWLYLSGLLAGFAASSKFSGMVMTAIFFCFVIWGLYWMRRLLSRSASTLGIFVLLCAFPPALWLIKSWIHTGNPVFFFAYDIFGGRNWDPVHARIWARFLGGIVRTAWSHYPILPWAMTIDTREFGGKLGPVFLAFIPAVLLGWRRGLPVNRFFPLFLVVILVPLLNNDVRLLMPVYALMATLAAYGYYVLAETGRPARYAATAIIVTGMLLNAGVLAGSFFRPPGSVPPSRSLKVIFGLETRDEYLSRSVPYYSTYKRANESLPVSSHVLIFNGAWGNQGYYLNRQYILGSPQDQAYYRYTEADSADEILSWYRRDDITYLIFHRDDISFNPKMQYPGEPAGVKACEMLREITAERVKPIFEKNGWVLAEMPAAGR